MLPPVAMDSFVLNGCSAGGLATFTWLDYFGKAIKAFNPKVKFFGLPDSGFFVNYDNVNTKDKDYFLKMQVLSTFVNKDYPYPQRACVEANPTTPAVCFLAETMLHYIESPVFISESLYDSWSVPNILGISCIADGTMSKCSEADKQKINLFRGDTATLLKTATSAKNNRGLWAPACIFHCYSNFGDDE